jgi:hypothetical protein
MNGDVKQAVVVFHYHGVVIELLIVVIRLMNEIAVCRKFDENL